MTGATEERSGIFIDEEVFGVITEMNEDLSFALGSIEVYKKKLKMTLMAMNDLRNKLEDVRKQIIEKYKLEDKPWIIDSKNKEIVYKAIETKENVENVSES